jgi:multidrug efflux system membrane fusion protein
MSAESDTPADPHGKPHSQGEPRHPLGPRGSHERHHGHEPEQHPHSTGPALTPSSEKGSHAPAAHAKPHEPERAPHKSQHHHNADGRKKPFYRENRFWTIWVPIIVVLLLIGGCVYIEKHKKAKATPPPPAIPVSVTTVRTGSIDVILDALGTVTPVYTVSVTARVTGAITEIDYKEGQMVKKNDLLLVIDPRPYAAAVQQAAGQLARDKALLDNARIDLGRYQDAFKTHAVPEQQLATQQATVKGDEGTVQLDQGNLEAAQANLDYTQVRSPIDGRVGLRQVDLGNVVSANAATPLAIITQLQPITVIFTLSEDYLGEVTPELDPAKPLRVDALDRAQQKQIAQGTLDTLDNQVNTSTGTVRARATFANAKNELFPNQFVNAKLYVKTLTNVLLVPTTAVQHNDTAAFVYVVVKDDKPAKDGKDEPASDDKAAKDPKESADGKDGKGAPDAKDAIAQIAKSTPVTITVTEGETAAVTGVKAGDTLVTDGFEKLQDGSRVSVKKPGQPDASKGSGSSGAKKEPAADGDKSGGS